MKKKVLENAGIVHLGKKESECLESESLVSRQLCLFRFSLLVNWALVLFQLPTLYFHPKIWSVSTTCITILNKIFPLNAPDRL